MVRSIRWRGLSIIQYPVRMFSNVVVIFQNKSAQNKSAKAANTICRVRGHTTKWPFNSCFALRWCIE